MLAIHSAGMMLQVYLDKLIRFGNYSNRVHSSGCKEIKIAGKFLLGLCFPGPRLPTFRRIIILDVRRTQKQEKLLIPQLR